MLGCFAAFCFVREGKGGAVLVSPFWDFFIKVATLLFKAVFFLLTVGGGVK